MTFTDRHYYPSFSCDYLSHTWALASEEGSQGHLAPQLTQFLTTQFDTEDMDRPHGYLVYLQYDNNFNLVPLGSGARRVEVNPTTAKEPVWDQLEHLLTDEILIETDGFMHMYVSNGSMSPIFYDNFEVTVMRGKTRQINHYYPYGLRINSIDGHPEDYKNMYTSKELQTGEFDPSGSTGLEMYDFHARFYDPQLGRWFAPDPAEQFSNPYLAMGNNPVMYVDPDGEFVTWSAHAGGWSIGFNLTPIGVPIGAGFNLNTSSVGAYVEFGPRVGGTGFGSGATVSQSFDINTNTGKFSTTTAASVYGSIGYGSAGVGYSYAHMAHNDKINWNVYIGFGWGNDETGMGLSMSYGSGGFSIGAGGYYNSKAWESNPTYDPDLWNDFDIRNSNNCYSYARDEAEARPYGTKPQPGDRGGKQIRSADYEEVLNASLADGLKKPNFFNKLGFGKRGYYSIYLVVDNQGLRQDYHWYRQDKGGTWSHKRGLDFVQNYDGSGPGKQIHNVRRANHNYGFDLNYNQGGIILWKRR